MGISKRRYEGYLEALKTYAYEVNEDFVVFTNPDESHEAIIEDMFKDEEFKIGDPNEDEEYMLEELRKIRSKMPSSNCQIGSSSESKRS